ncbi:GNAT family N-acetyltransferase [Halobacillus mangrovi]|uniref:N-acetyltransferase n=1 Tax=Halobacillus mangrovi TaxID=402384 RepID=A0A1W5ZX20_9BACI|nr:GNAT family N-acetyltransferase [Halobacillus mangrovi]ARI77823.1 N-acetyltransferase [Halobacillus mangrovi]
MNKSVKIQPMQEEDWLNVREIYREGISSGNATFEKEVPTWDEWTSSHLTNCRIVAKMNNEIKGWAALAPVSSRCVYQGVAEVSVYVEKDCEGHGIGFLLLEELIRRSEEAGIWTLQSGIFPENLRSLRLHKRCGFREVGRRERIGKIDGEWRDVLLLEKRSKRTGV